ncbi:SH3 domain-containing protein [Lentinula novae-zelandiae]|nr:SH3 domain-containing protein [Lentinula novae-zelandiae]
MSLQPQPSHTSLSSVTSLSRYASAKSPSIDPYNGNPSRDFCNSFWGGDGDAGVNVLFARMRGGVRTIEGLKGFWKERAAIEEDYAKRMGELAGVDFGRDEIGELRNSLTTLQLETTKLAQTHLQLANQIRSEMEDPAAAMLNKLSDHKRLVMSAVEKRHKAKLQAEVYVVKAREKYYGDCVRIGVCRQQLQQLQENPNSGDLEKVRSKLKRLEQTVAANEKDYAAFTKSLADSLPAWESEWRSFCDGCQDLEEERLDFMKDNLWAYANSVSTVCVADDESCEAIRTVLDQFETDRDILAFVQEYGTGSSIPNPPEFILFPASTMDPSSNPTSSQLSTTISTHPATFSRKSRKSGVPPAAPPYVAAQTGSSANPSSHPASHSGHSGPSASSITTAPTTAPPVPPPNVPPPSIPAPPMPTGSIQQRGAGATPSSTASPARPTDNEVAAPIPPVPTMGTGGSAGGGAGGERNKILFYGEFRAMYDYTATIPEEFNFQAGDIIAVTDIPDDGWWSGELLDEERREEGRCVFPSNFVRLF